MASMDMSAKDLEDRCDEIFLRFEAMLCQTEVTSPSAQMSPRPTVVTEKHSPSGTGHSYLPSPVNQFLHAVEISAPKQGLENSELTQAVASPPDMQKEMVPDLTKSTEQGKENRPGSEPGSSKRQSTEESDVVEHASTAAHLVPPGFSDEVSSNQHHVREMQQQLDIAKRVTDEQHSMFDPLRSVPCAVLGHCESLSRSCTMTAHKSVQASSPRQRRK